MCAERRVSGRGVSVDGNLIRQDRMALGLTQEGLIELTAGSVSVETLRRAEKGERIDATKLRALCAALGQPTARYADGGISSDPVPPLSFLAGDWRYIQACTNDTAGSGLREAYVRIKRERSTIAGELAATSEFDATTACVTDVRMRGLVVTARIEPTRSSSPGDQGFLHILPARGYDWLEGYTTWYDFSRHRIECFESVWIRIGAETEEAYKQLARTRLNPDSAADNLPKREEWP